MDKDKTDKTGSGLAVDSVSAGSDLCDAAEKLHEAFYTMLRDWRDGDFELPRYAELHMNAMESRAIRLGQVIYSIQNAEDTRR